MNGPRPPILRDTFPCPRCGRPVEIRLVPVTEELMPAGDLSVTVRVEFEHECPEPQTLPEAA